MRTKDDDADRFLGRQTLAESPTSMKMKNTFLLKHNNPSFDNYAAMMKKRRFSVTMPAQFGGSSAAKADETGSSAVLSKMQREMALKINPINPQARDGHACVLFDGKMVIFGGDRHHMPFNDLFLLDLNDFFFKETA